MNSCFKDEGLEGNTVVVTGATGLIGKTLVKRLLKNDVKVVAVVRNRNKAEELFGNKVQYSVGDIRTVDLSLIQADYIVHAASQTASAQFVQKPVETISVAVDGTKHMLEYAKTQTNLKRFVYLSTMEVYGTPQTDEKIDELHNTNLNTMSVRSCYPESKRLCESLCASYCTEYQVPVNVLRLTQTFGPGVVYDDGRVFAEFARCVIESKDIILKTKGETKRTYLYTEDAINALLTVMTQAPVGEMYNAANEETYCSIYEMAQMVANEIAGGKIKVKIEEDNNNNDFGFAPTLHMNLDTKKLRSLGWQAMTNLKQMYLNMIKAM